MLHGTRSWSCFLERINDDIGLSTVPKNYANFKRTEYDLIESQYVLIRSGFNQRKPVSSTETRNRVYLYSIAETRRMAHINTILLDASTLPLTRKSEQPFSGSSTLMSLSSLGLF